MSHVLVGLSFKVHRGFATERPVEPRPPVPVAADNFHWRIGRPGRNDAPVRPAAFVESRPWPTRPAAASCRKTGRQRGELFSRCLRLWLLMPSSAAMVSTDLRPWSSISTAERLKFSSYRLCLRGVSFSVFMVSCPLAHTITPHLSANSRPGHWMMIMIRTLPDRTAP
jgi:hypothetical protein